jgi:enolase
MPNARLSRQAITAVDAIEILDCRGDPTLRVNVTLADGTTVWADVPAGKSTGAHEAQEVRDDAPRYGGRGVTHAMRNIVDEIGPSLVGMDATRQREIDTRLIALDGSKDKHRLGANALVGVSLAVARAAASSLGIPLYRYINVNAHVLPVPLLNLINGGKHASNDLDFQEVCIFPVGAESFAEAMEISHRVNAELREIVIAKYGKLAANVGDEGGFAPPVKGVREALDCLQRAVSRSGHEAKILYGLDCAATHFYDREKKTYRVEGKTFATGELLEFYRSLAAELPIASIEDPFAEDDVDGFVRAARELKAQIVGDDFFCTNPARIHEGVAARAANAVLWKVNQIGTLSEAIDAAELAYRSGYAVMVSERSGETEDPMIADLTVGLNAGQIKTGAPVRGERTAKYNRLLEIERDLGACARYAGAQFRVPF